MSLLKTNEIQVFNGTTVTITATTTETSADLNVGADLDVTGALTLGTALAVAEGGTGATDAATARTNLDVDQAGTDNSTDVSLVTTSHDYLSIAGQAITLGPIDLAADVTGTLATSNGGTGVSSLSSLDAADLGSGSATDGYVLTSDGAGGAAWEAASGGGGGTVSGINLIINGDFRVNQRGAASRTATSNAYNYDRWYYDGTYLYQGVEDKSIANGTYTLTWVDAGSDITAAYVVSTDSSNNNGPDSGLTYTSVSNGGNITVSEGTEYSKHLWIRFSGTLANLADVQLEAGTVATPFERRLIGTELALCQRYFQKITDYLVTAGRGNGTSAIFTMLPLACQMRTSPAIVTTAALSVFRTSQQSLSLSTISTWQAVSPTSSTVLSVSLNHSGGTTDNYQYVCQISGSGDFIKLDAEL